MEHCIKKHKDSVALKVDQEIYPLTTIYAAGYVFLDRAYIYLDKDKSNTIMVWLYPKHKKEDLRQLGLDFYNELLNYAHFYSNLKINSDVIKILMQRALFSAAPQLIKEAGKKEAQNILKELDEEENGVRYPFLHSQGGRKLIKLHQSLYSQALFEEIKKDQPGLLKFFNKQNDYYYVGIEAEGIEDYLYFLNCLIHYERNK